MVRDLDSFARPKESTKHLKVLNIKHYRYILNYGVESTFGVEPWSGVLFGVVFESRVWSELS